MNFEFILAIVLASFVSVYLFCRQVDLSQTILKLLEALAAGVSSLTDNQLTDLQKEESVKRYATLIILHSLKLFWLVIIVASPFPVVLTILSLISSKQISLLTIQIFEVLNFSIIAAASILAYVFFRKENNNVDAPEVNYSNLERVVHDLAMVPSVARFLSFCDSLFDTKKPYVEQRPVFIIGLARGGTTAILNALFSSREFTTYTYRFMPMITMPLIINFLSRPTKTKRKKMHERAHKDGHQIDSNSPEAFDEIFFKLYFPEIYEQDEIRGIEPELLTKPFINFFRGNINRLTSVPKAHQAKNIDFGLFRYVSKNNANISRINALKSMFPNASFILIFRDPMDHAKSLLRQHRLFSKLQKSDPFVLKYMNDIGHFEFGNNAKALRLGRKFVSKYSKDDLAYWLDYWTYVYGFVVREHPHLVYLSLENLIQSERKYMEKLLHKIGASQRNWVNKKKFFKPGTKDDTEEAVDVGLKNKAYSVHRKLLDLAI